MSRLIKSLVLCMVSVVVLPSVSARRITHAEEWYRLYHSHLHRYPEDEFDNLVYLERALAAPFINALYALAKINTSEEWEFYQNLFRLHVNLQIVRTYMALAMKYDREVVYFYNEPWREQNLRSLNIAEKYYNRALHFWSESLKWVEELNVPAYRWLFLQEVRHWHNEWQMINDGSLDFAKILARHLQKLASHREQFESMGEGSGSNSSNMTTTEEPAASAPSN